METRCWNCSRAYSRTDPEGCEFHRVENKLDYIERADYLKAVVEPRKNSNKSDLSQIVIVVTECQHYDRESREPSSQKMAPKAPPKKTRNKVAIKTHCIRGHEYSEENTYITANGHRECRKCRAESRRKHRLEGIG